MGPADPPAGARYLDEKEQWVGLKGDEIASMNMWGFTPTMFKYLEQKFPPFLKQAGGNLKAEFLMPSVADELIKAGKITMKILNTPAQWLGVTYKEDKPSVQKSIQELIARKVYPTPLWK